MPPVEHIVLFKLKADAPEALKEDMLRDLLSLEDRIPGILSVSAGKNFTARGQGYTHGFVVRFVDRAAMEVYLTHPLHVAVVSEKVKPISDGVLAMDYDLM